jgi:hypothetical protein
MASDILAEQRRDACARQLVKSAPWPIATLNKPHGAFPAGTVFYRVPSSDPSRRYLANDRACECKDYQRAGNVCKHVRAVRMWQAREEEAAGLASMAEIDAAFAGVAADATARDEAARRLPTHGARCLTDMDAQAALDAIQRRINTERLLSASDDDVCSVDGCGGWATISGGTCREHSRQTVRV